MGFVRGGDKDRHLATLSCKYMMGQSLIVSCKVTSGFLGSPTVHK